MKKFLILVCSLAIGTAAFAAPAKTAKPRIAHFAGTIEKYDVGTHTLTVKHAGKDSTFQVGDGAQVMKGKEKADASALAASTGQAAKVNYILAGTVKTAEKIEVSGAHAAPAKKK